MVLLARGDAAGSYHGGRWLPKHRGINSATVARMYAGQSDFRKNLLLFLAVFLPLVLIIIGIGTWYVGEQEKVVLEHYQVEARHHVEGQVNRVQRFYKQGAAIILALSRAKSVTSALAGDANARKEVADIFTDIIRISGAYDQVRLLDAAGREVVRVNRHGNEAHVVPAGRLQNKARRDYVRQTLKLSRGTIYVSPFNLNMEHGKVQRPYKSVVRFATPLVDDAGIRNGLLVINILGIKLMQRELSETVLEGEHLLINAGSPYWFDRQVNELHVFESMDDVVQTHRFSKGWLRVLKEDKGQFATAEGQFTFKSITPVLADKLTNTIQPYWQIVSFVPSAALAAAAGSSASQAMTICIILIVLLGLVIGLWSQRFIMKQLSEQSTRHSETRLRLAEKDADMGYWDWDMLSDTVTWSDGFNRIFGFDGAHVAPCFDTVTPCVHPDDLEFLKAAVVETIHSHDRHETEFRIICDGKERYIHASGKVVFSEGTRPLRMFGTIHDITESRQAEQQREALLKANRRLAQGLIQAREDERTMLARALHDEIGQKLTAIQMHVSVITDQCASRDYKAAKGGLRMIGKLAQELIGTVRNQLKQLRPPQLDELGLKAALSFMCREWQGSSGVDCHLRVSDAADALDDDVRSSLYRIVQGALTNIARHAGASKAYVNLRVNEDIHLTIRDNGCGFDPDAQTDGIGLTGMHERMELLGGSMRIKSAPGKGARLIFRIPYPPPRCMNIRKKPTE